MKTSAATNLRILLAKLKEFGLLLETDAKLPSVSGLVAGEPVRGSWWSHPRSHGIFAVLQEIVDHKDVLVAKLVSAKVTFVHRLLWPEVISIGLAREDWQMVGLSPPAKILLAQSDQAESLATNEIIWPRKFKALKPGDAVRELEKRLLIHSEEFHSDNGAHAKLIESWEHWTRRIGFKHERMKVENAKRNLNERIEALNSQFGASAKLPWPQNS
jgi:hypothetical protein